MRSVLIAALCLGVPAVALADDDKPADKGEGTDVEMEEDAPPEDMEGVNENPDAPRLVGDEHTEVTATTPSVTRTGYPIEEVLRPLTLPAVTSEVALEAHSTFGDFDAGFGLRARYGITKQMQIGLRYEIGGLYDDTRDSKMDKAVFNTGKAVALDFTYLIKDFVAARLTLPAYVQPFGMAMTLGAPMKFTFADKFSIVALDDFIDIKLVKFIPSLTDERYNEDQVEAIDNNTRTPSTVIHARVGVIYQQSPNLAIKGNLQQTFYTGASDTFTGSESPTGIEGIVQYSPNAKMDITGRLGIDALDDAGDTFGLLVGAAYRI